MNEIFAYLTEKDKKYLKKNSLAYLSDCYLNYLNGESFRYYNSNYNAYFKLKGKIIYPKKIKRKHLSHEYSIYDLNVFDRTFNDNENSKQIHYLSGNEVHYLFYRLNEDFNLSDYASITECLDGDIDDFKFQNKFFNRIQFSKISKHLKIFINSFDDLSIAHLKTFINSIPLKNYSKILDFVLFDFNSLKLFEK